MSKFKLENFWKFMKKYNANEENEIESDFLCVLCKKILINAHISPCTCRFCFDCISNYLNKEKKICPGNKDDCKMELISLNENIAVDHAINYKIAKLIVKCSDKNCGFKDELSNIDNHIRICNYQSVCCPYFNIGCNSYNMHTKNVIDHLQLEIVNHTKLLIDCIDNLNNDIGTLKIIVDKLGEENKMLKCEIKLDEEKKQMKMKCDEQMREIDLLNEDMVALRNVDKYTRDDVDELKLDGKRKQIEIDKLNKKLQEMELKFEIESKSVIEKEFDKFKLDGERKEKELERKCAEQTRKIYLLNEEIVKLRNVDECLIEHVDKLKLDGERNKKSIETLENKCEQRNKQIQQFNRKYQQIENKFINANQERENKEKSIETLENKCEQKNKQIQPFNKKHQEIENKFVNAKQERENKEKDLMRNIDEMGNKQTEMKKKSNKIDKTMKNVENKLLKIEIINQNKMINGEFVWIIDEINDKMKDAKNGINTIIYSDSFYTHQHGYKMCLRVYPNGGGGGKSTHLSVYFCLMKGDFDILQWPFKYDVTFSLVNQQTRLAHIGLKIKYNDLPNSKNWNKPISERNDFGIGFDKFIKLKELSKANLMINNQIFIKYSVNISS